MCTMYLVQPEDRERDERETLNKRKSTKDWVEELTTTLVKKQNLSRDRIGVKRNRARTGLATVTYISGEKYISYKITHYNVERFS